MKTVAVLGGGVAGLTAASDLVHRGHRVVVFEAQASPGGFVQSHEEGGWLSESGPNSMQWGDPDLKGLVDRLGLAGDLLVASPLARHRYLVRRGRLEPLPMSPPALLTSKLLSLGAKARIASEYLRRPRSRPPGATVAEVMGEHFGAEVLGTLVQPFVSGIFAGDPAALSFEHAFPALAAMEREHGSFIQGQMARSRLRRKAGEPAMPPLVSLRHGLGGLVDALVRSLPPGSLRCQAPVAELVPGAGWAVRLAGRTAPEPTRFDAVVSTLPAPALKELTLGGGQPLRELGQVACPPIASLFLGFPREAIRHPLDGFGVLVPASENLALLGCLFSSSLFPGRAPEGHVALTCLAGGALAPGMARLDAGSLEERLLPELDRLLGVRATPVVRRHAVWTASIPQYAPGHERLLALLSGCEARYPGLFVGGMVRDGISLPAAIASGRRLAGCATA